MSKKSRKKNRRDRIYPVPRRNPKQDDYLKRRDRVISVVNQTHFVHVHTRRIHRMGLLDEIELQIASRKKDNVTKVSRDEAHAILRLFQAEFKDIGRIYFKLGE